MDNDLAQTQHLVSAIERITPLSAHVRQAFLSVARVLFVPQYYRRQGRVLNWAMVDTGDAAYTDEALVTKVDPISKHPTSSSSQPSLMAIQLEALDLQPGQRVLEIGAGTGYNAALMAHIVGSTGHVVSIDVDYDLAHAAKQHLAIAGYEQVQVVCGDGLQGYEGGAPYDRILATGSFRSFPRSWFDQLTAHGRLVGNLVGNLASVFICLKKKQAVGDGILLPIGGDKRYMELHHGQFLPPHLLDWAVYDVAILKEHLIHFDFPTLIENTDFLFLLQCFSPRLERHWRYNQAAEKAEVYFVTEQSCLTVQACSPHEWLVQEKGSGGLWEHLYEAYQLWIQYNHPSLADYHVSIDQSGQYISLGDMRWQLTQND